jgi:hypothetical protein
MHTLCILNAYLCRHHAEIMQTSIQVCIWHTFWFSYAKYAQGKYADLINTLCRLVKTFCRLGADYNTTYTSVHQTQCFVITRQVLHGNLLTKLWFFAGPTWRQRDGSVLVASRRFDGSRSRKTKGSLANSLQCNIWRRAQSPHRMTHSLHGGDNHGKFNGFAALGKAIGTPNSTDKDCAYVTEHTLCSASGIVMQT